MQGIEFSPFGGQVEANGFGKAAAEHFSAKDYGVGNCVAQTRIGPAYVTIDDQLIMLAIRGYCDVSRVRGMRVARLASRLHNANGFRAHKKRAYDTSAKSFAKAFELDPTFGQASFNLACAESLRGRKAEAIKALKKAYKRLARKRR